MSVAIFVAVAISIHQGPPPPGVLLSTLYSASVTGADRAESEAMLTTLSGAYFTFRPDVETSDAISECAGASSPHQCVADSLASRNTPKGAVAIVVERSSDGGLTWRCLGNAVRPFRPDEQVFQWQPPFTAAGSETAVTLRRRAAACISFAGYQSGW